MKNKLIFIVPAILVIVAVVVLTVKALGGEPVYVTGIVEATEADVASKLPGRVDSVFVNEGDVVKKGQPLGKLESKEMDAKLEQARGLMRQAESKMMMAHNGARIEEKRATENLYLQALHQYELAEKTWKRVESLYKDDVISAQEKDQTEFKYKAAKEQLDAAKAKYDMVMKGARDEEIMGAEALYLQGENGYKEALAYYQELVLKSPIDGEVSKRITDPGEIIAAGYPLFTVIDLNDNWVTLQVREDRLEKFTKGAKFMGRIPALGNTEHEFVVAYVSSMADFATWKPTNQKGDFDLKTFEVRLRSVEPIKNLRAGMTVNISL
ncbi:MAG TPA: efflux RND transporter periplasmic adaptor subunit [Ignavibacteriales bacterium]|nr:efflux RND transporter periplasmic adaptor subunit [Ignavibacteriales bacterium]